MINPGKMALRVFCSDMTWSSLFCGPESWFLQPAPPPPPPFDVLAQLLGKSGVLFRAVKYTGCLQENCDALENENIRVDAYPATR
ncbi:hypothetical protein AURDEDRAFT_170985 [Auricularia subglabra TFB-10046 SS5]|nr:hypothetical protein AURDEDRAFT_170985 [Auricularia subglabra TFB-10046 SS5]